MATVEVMRPIVRKFESPLIFNSRLTAYGNNQAVTIVDMKSEVLRPIKIIQRPAVCYERAVSTLSWGYGMTPSNKSKSRPLLAIGWDKVIMLMSVKDESQEIDL